jgi:hypothetical protein
MLITLAHVSRWFHNQLFPLYEQKFSMWMKYVGSGFIDACLSCEEIDWWTRENLLEERERSGNSKCEKCHVIAEIERLRLVVDGKLFSQYYIDQIAEDIKNLKRDENLLRDTSCKCEFLFLPAWKCKSLARVAKTLTVALKDANRQLPPWAELYFDASERNILTREDIDPDPTGYDLDFVEEFACEYEAKIKN